MADPELRPILLVEDDGQLAAFMARHLSAHRMPTVVVMSAEEAERRLRSGLRPALVLLDINLPGETGWSLLRSPAYVAAGAPPVVVVSATRVPSSRLREFGVAGYLPKPFAMQTLMDTVRRYAPGFTGDHRAAPADDPFDLEMP